MTTDTKSHGYWMRIALEEAERAMQAGEIPVAAILVSRGKEIARAQTQVARRGTLAAHAELFAILEANGQLWTAEHPLVIYTNLEPCLMCIGSAIQVGVDEIVYGMDAAPDGGARYIEPIRWGGQNPPRITAHVMEHESLELMKRLPIENPDQPALEYVHAMLRAYDE